MDSDCLSPDLCSGRVTFQDGANAEADLHSFTGRDCRD